MATTGTVAWLPSHTSAIEARWAALGGAENGDSFEWPEFGDKTVTVTGTFGGATVKIQGSNDNTNWFDVVDFLGNAIALTSAGMKTLGNSPRYLRPSTTGGTGSSLDIRIIARGSAR